MTAGVYTVDEFFKMIDEKDPLVRYPDGRISYEKAWQGWSLDPSRVVPCAPCDLTYEVSLEDCTSTHKLRDTIFHIANKGDHYKVQGLLRALGAVMAWTKTIKKGRWSASEGRWAAAKFAKNPHRCSTA